ncbi:MAG: tyrosine-type recombinase/integrase [Rhodospirillaceae bacterium]|nr:tyrosine-type recombinase/integrase [Rhodospirillaceae bacterium]
MRRRGLTAAAVENINPPKTGQIEKFDGAGLSLRVGAGGSKTFVLNTRVSGKMRRIRVGEYRRDPDHDKDAATKAAGDALVAARAEAARIVSQIKSGIDPVARREEEARAAEVERQRRAMDTFGAVLQEFLRRDQSGNRGAAEVRRLLEKECERWADRPIDEITAREVVALLNGVADRPAPVMANRLHAHMRRLFRWAVENAVIGASPMAAVKKPSPEKSRDRVLNDSEIAEIWRAAEALGHPFGTLVKLLVCTGARRSEIAEAQWADIDWAERKLSIPAARSKNATEHQFPLNDLAMQVLAATPRFEIEVEGKGGKRIMKPAPWIITARGDNALSAFSASKKRLDGIMAKARPAVAEGPEDVEPMPHWTIHDIRRSVATGLARMNVPIHVVERLLNHRTGSVSGVAAIYNRHAYWVERRHALDLWNQHLGRLLDPAADATAVPLRAGAE